MTVEIENMNLTLESREEYEARLILEMVTHKPTRVDIKWDGEQWVVKDIMEEEEDTRVEIHSEEIATGIQADTMAKFEAAISKLKGTTLELSTLKLIAKAIAYGFEQAPDRYAKPVLRNMVSEIAHSMNRKGLVSNDDVSLFVADLYAELKI